MDTGTVRYDLRKSAWFGSITLVALIAGPLTLTPSALALFALASAFTLCAGHSVGIHRGLIHRSYRVPLWLERTLAYLGTLVGLGDPIGLLRMHNTRDAQQNRPACHDYFAHRQVWWRDCFWNLHCRFDFDGNFTPREDARVESDAFYRFLARTWRWQQLPWALAFYALGGVSWLVWGAFVRVAVSTTGHWLVGHVAHRAGEQRFVNAGAAVQGFNSKLFGALSMGEGWHNNHHTHPRSAQMGIEPGQLDLGWLFVRALEKLGLATDVHTANIETRAPAALRVSRPSFAPWPAAPARP
ncbi:MAG: acyl-CoA desaturase [Deltaproteobacteria bacterium]|nr:acyl-CoA desaturase [Deltaproteobacteria bacterium]